MHRILCLLALVLAFTIVPLMPASEAGASVFDPSDYYEIVIVLEEGIDPIGYADYFLGQIGVDYNEHKAERVHHKYRHAFTGFSVYLSESEYATATRRELIDQFTATGMESMLLSEWGQFATAPITEAAGEMPTHPLAASSEVVPTGLMRSGSIPGADYSSVDVAVIDTGVDKTHTDLNVVDGIDCTARYGEGADWGFDGYGHGTHVAGTIAAEANGEGVVGVAPGARIHSVKVLGNDGSGSYASILCGLDWVVMHADVIDVANMSLGGTGTESSCDSGDVFHYAICALDDLGVIVVVAAGNSSADAGGHVPATYDEVITVSAWADFDGQAGGAAIAPQDGCYGMSTDDFMAAFSNYGKDVDISAPGTCILSTLPSVDGEPAYGYASGTSMATPHVTACIAKYLAENPDQREHAREQMLTYSAAHHLATNEKDGIAEPLLWCDSVPRYEGNPSDYQG